MAHLTTDLRSCCKNCIFLGYYDDRQASWYYCSLVGDAYNSQACKQVDHVIKTVFEKRNDDIVPRFYQLLSSCDCSSRSSVDDLISFVDRYLSGNHRIALLHVLKHYKN